MATKQQDDGGGVDVPAELLHETGDSEVPEAPKATPVLPETVEVKEAAPPCNGVSSNGVSSNGVSVSDAGTASDGSSSNVDSSVGGESGEHVTCSNRVSQRRARGISGTEPTSDQSVTPPPMRSPNWASYQGRMHSSMRLEPNLAPSLLMQEGTRGAQIAPIVQTEDHGLEHGDLTRARTLLVRSGSTSSVVSLQTDISVLHELAAEAVDRAPFDALDSDGDDLVHTEDLRRALRDLGFSLETDPRFASLHANLSHFEEQMRTPNPETGERREPLLTYAQFRSMTSKDGILIGRALRGDLVIPDWARFCSEVVEMYHYTRSFTTGKPANYIPQLAKVNPEQYGVAICTTDGQRVSFGDSRVSFCAQSCSKPITYAMALSDWGQEAHRFVGREPSGRNFNELVLNADGLPHNPLINSGAIMCCALIGRSKNRMIPDAADRLDHVLDTWSLLMAGRRPSFNASVFLSEKNTADRNFALAYMMRENGVYPDAKAINVHEVLEFYFQICSLEVDCEGFAVVAATLANYGINPLTGKRVFSPRVVRNTLSMMFSCGMYDYSGEFAYQIGIPAKSGVSGALLIVVPGTMGICTWSPRLDKLGNSVRGVEFCKQLVSKFSFHHFDNLTAHEDEGIRDPTERVGREKDRSIMTLMFAASEGDLKSIQQIVASGVDLDIRDYDNRTALHVASSEGHLETVRYLLKKGVNCNAVDRWGNTALDDAMRERNDRVARLLKMHGAGSGHDSTAYISRLDSSPFSSRMSARGVE